MSLRAFLFESVAYRPYDFYDCVEVRDESACCNDYYISYSPIMCNKDRGDEQRTSTAVKLRTRPARGDGKQSSNTRILSSRPTSWRAY